MRNRVAAESIEEREVRLQQMSTYQGERLATETVEEREARLQQTRSSQVERLAAENAEEREARQQHDRESLREQRVQRTLGQLHLPLLQQRSVQAKMRKFHAHMAALEVSRCSTCSEAFPGLHLRPGSTECVRCSRDKHTPKVYSTANNMHPGPIPTQLQVIVFAVTVERSTTIPILIVTSCNLTTMYICLHCRI